MAATVTSYGQYCPISRALDVLGERWTLLILRDMYVGTTRFNDLARGLPGLSRTLLAKRLRRLEMSGLVDHFRGEYLLTPAGEALEPVLMGLGDWGARWSFGDPDPEELDPQLLVWWMHRRIDTSAWPGVRHVVKVVFPDVSRRFWVHVERGEAAVCLTDPGFDVDITLTSDVATLYRVWMGDLDLAAARRAGAVRVEGPARLTRDIGDVLQLSQVAPMVAGSAAARGAGGASPRAGQS